MDSTMRTEAVKLSFELMLLSGMLRRASLFPALTDLPWNETSGITNRLLMDSGNDPSRTAKILDALARVGLNSKGVIAVAVAPSAEPKKNTVLFIAINEAVVVVQEEYHNPLSTHQAA